MVTLNIPPRQPQKITMVKLIYAPTLEGLEKQINNFILHWRTVVAGSPPIIQGNKWIMALWYSVYA